MSRKMKNIHFICWIYIFAWTFYLSYQKQHIPNVCFLINQSNETWKLVWEDLFDNPELNNNWHIQHEDKMFCRGLVNCNVRQNVNVKNGFLILNVRQQSHGKYNYTGAEITSRKYFSPGRFEIRAAQPIGRHIVTLMLIVNDAKHKLHLDYKNNIVNYFDKQKFYRGFYFLNEKTNLTGKNHSAELRTNLIQRFHLFGYEWSGRKFQFYFDDQYSKPMKFDSFNKSNLFQIALQIGINEDIGTLANDKIDWKCAALLVDHVRIYEKVFRKSGSLNLPVNSCALNNLTETVIHDICKMSLSIKIVETENFLISVLYNHCIFVIIVALLVLLICYQSYIIVKMKKTISNNPTINFSSSTCDGIYESYIYYEHRSKENENVCKPISYLNLYDANNTRNDAEILINGERATNQQQGRATNKYVSIKKAKSDNPIYYEFMCPQNSKKSSNCLEITTVVRSSSINL